MSIKLYNTLARKKQTFKPIHGKKVNLYTCGPTVYHFAHIGNLRPYVHWDILKRTLNLNGYKVKHAMNITDVGHLTSDADEGEDKMEKGAKREGKTVWDIAKFYTDKFFEDTDKLNIKKPDVTVPATSAIKEQIKLIKKLREKSYAYETAQAIYFDVSKFKNYTKLSRQKLGEKITGAREEVIVDPKKNHPHDFALWFKRTGRFKNHAMHWPSPWGEGFPGWHIECSAIAKKYLGQPIDIHTGGVDHVAVHHTNEIAQSEAAENKPLAKFWLHNEHLLIKNEKIAKSAGNFVTLSEIIKRGVDPLAFRYLILTAHYRSKLNFTWESLRAAQNALENLRNIARELKNANQEKRSKKQEKEIENYQEKFKKAVNDDLNTPKALAVLWETVKDKKLSPALKKKLLLEFDDVLRLKLKDAKTAVIPQEIEELAKKRENLRGNRQFIKADGLRRKIEELGYTMKDTPEGPIVQRKS